MLHDKHVTERKSPVTWRLILAPPQFTCYVCNGTNPAEREACNADWARLPGQNKTFRACATGFCTKLDYNLKNRSRIDGEPRKRFERCKYSPCWDSGLTY